RRGDADWLYVDAGVFNAFMETIDGFSYEIRSERSGSRESYTRGAPSCDSVDIPFKDVSLEDVRVGDRLYVMNAGAYTTVYASRFNGFAIPRIDFTHD